MIALAQDKIQERVQRHDRLWGDPARAERLVTFVWAEGLTAFDREKVLYDSACSLEFSLRRLEMILEAEDDSIPMVRAEFGTVLPASAFGVDLLVRPDSPPAVKTHPITSHEALDKIGKPDPVRSGLFPLAYCHIAYFRTHLPEGVRLCQCDMQGPWNTSHLLAGDKIFYDVYDDPDLIDRLLDAVTDFMIEAIGPMKKAIGEEWDCFYLQGTKIPGASRLCNCSTDMISADFYEAHVLERDCRFFDAMNGGFIHICGNNPHCFKHFNKIDKLHGVEFNFNYQDLFQVADMLREDMVLLCTGPVEPPLLTPLGKATLERFYRGEFPDKKNILFHFDDPADLDKCKKLYDAVHRGNR